MSDFIATPTIEEFMLSDAYVRVLAGPIGAGKSVACVHELIRWAALQAPDANNKRRTRFLVVRNTVDQLRSTTLKTIQDWFPPGVYGSYKSSEKTLNYVFALPDNTIVETEWMLVSLDEPADIRKALSLEATGLWGNECRELHSEVIDGLLMRVNRFPSMKDGGPTRAGAIFDTNMPGEESFWEQRMSNPPENWSIHIQPPAVIPLDEYIELYKEDPPETLRSAEDQLYAINPDAENLANLHPTYYPNTLMGKTEDFIGVYLRCKYGRTLSGLPVYDKTFSATKHISPTPLEPIRSENYPLCIGLDFGRSPAAVICQLTPRGNINVLSEVVGENMGIQTFTTTLLRPHLYEKYPGITLYLAPDPAGWQKTQVGETSPVDYLKQAGFTVVKPPTNNPKLRIEAVDAALAASVDAVPRVRIDKSCSVLLAGFRGRYKWKTNKAGDLVDAPEPIKNHPWSDVADAFQYAVGVIDGAPALANARKRREIHRAKAVGWT